MIGFYRWFSTDPPVLFQSFGLEDIGHHLPEDPIIRFVTYMWHSSTNQILASHHEACALRPAHMLHHLVNDPMICRQLVAKGIPAHFVSSNSFIDERLYVVQRSTEKRYDAVYNARMTPFKRHALAQKIPRLLVIGGVVSDDDTDRYFQEQIALMPNADFVHASDGRPRSPDEVTTLLNQARVGLCLSACEGAMFASTEYLLCGLPVVSTVSEGGRDVWYDSRFTRIVRDDPDAVAVAVSELSTIKMPPEYIRAETLNRLWEHRRRFLDLGQTIYAATNIGRDFARDFYANFTNKMGDWRPYEDVMKWYDHGAQSP